MDAMVFGRRVDHRIDLIPAGTVTDAPKLLQPSLKLRQDEMAMERDPPEECFTYLMDINSNMHAG